MSPLTTTQTPSLVSPLFFDMENPQFPICFPKTNTLFFHQMYPLFGKMTGKPPAMAVESIRFFFDTRNE